MSRAVLATMLVALVLSACSGSDNGSVDSSLPATTGVDTPATITPETTSPQPPTTTPVTAPTGSAPPVGADAPVVLVADEDGARVVRPDGGGDVFVEGTAVEIAYPDLAGGVVLQTTEPSGLWTWDVETEGVVYVPDDPGALSPIQQVTAPGAEPVDLVGTGDGPVWLDQVVELEDRRTVVYRLGRADPEAVCEADDVGCVRRAVTHHLMLHRLDTGEVNELGVVTGLDTTAASFVLSDQWAVLLTQIPDEGFGCGVVLATSQLRGVAGEGEYIGEEGAFWRRCEFGWGGAISDADVALASAVAPDGSTIAYLINVGDGPMELVVIQTASGELEEQRRIAIDEFDYAPAWLDWDGEYAVTGDAGGFAPLLIGPDGSVGQFPAGHVVLWRES